MLCMIYVPTLGKVSTDWAQRYFYMHRPLGNVLGELFNADRVSIADKRNHAIASAIANGAKTLLFIGDDVHPPVDTINLLLQRWREGAKAVTGVYWTKTNTPEPYIYRGYMDGPYWDWKAGEYFPIDWAGCDCLLLDVEMLKHIPEPWFSLEYEMRYAHQRADESRPWNDSIHTEDLYFFAKLKDAGVQLMCDSAIQCWHEDRTTGRLYGLTDGMPQKTRPEVWKAQTGLELTSGKLIADIGCGHTTNPFYVGNTLHRFDSDETCNPTFRCDVREIPAPSDTYDIALAWHVLEHLELKDAAPAMREWGRIVKEGGELIVKVPNLSFAAERIAKDEKYIGDVRWQHPYELLMVYGSQENPAMFHRSGFTKFTLNNYATQGLGGEFDFRIEGTQLIDGEPSELTLFAKKKLSQKPLKAVADSYIKPEEQPQPQQHCEILHNQTMTQPLPVQEQPSPKPKRTRKKSA